MINGDIVLLYWSGFYFGLAELRRRRRRRRLAHATTIGVDVTRELLCRHCRRRCRASQPRSLQVTRVCTFSDACATQRRETDCAIAFLARARRQDEKKLNKNRTNQKFTIQLHA